MPKKPPIIFTIDKPTEQVYKQQLQDYFKFFLKQSISKAKTSTTKAYGNLIRGLGIDGGELKNPDLAFFDEVLKVETNNFCTVDAKYIGKHRKKTQTYPPTKRKPTHQPSQLSPEDVLELQEELDQAKSELIKEYPSFARKDLKNDVDTYCHMGVKLKRMAQDNSINTKEIKELTETRVKLGSYLGINESEKAKEKAMEDRQSIAAMSLEFSRTIEEISNLKERLLFKELRMWLAKYDRRDINFSKELFELPSYAGMSVETARKFIEDNKYKYE